MTLDRPQIVRVGQAVNACYDPYFLDRPERAEFPAPHQVIWGTDKDGPRPYGVIYLDPVLDAWMVAIRGTDSTSEWISDFETAMIECPFLPGARSHLGFTTIYNTMIADGAPIRTHLAGLQRPIIVAGHSLGAALATLIAIDVGGVVLVTFAGPRVGDDAFAHMGMTRLAAYLRIVNKPDLVPNIPLRLPDFPYAHLGVAMELDSTNEVKMIPQAWHSLGTYLHLLDQRLPVEPEYAASSG